MSFLKNKRKRNEISFESRELLYDSSITRSTQSKTYLNFFNEGKTNSYDENINNNNVYNVFNIFQPLFADKISKRKKILSPFYDSGYNFLSDKGFQNKRIKLFFSPPSFQFEKNININAFINNNYNNFPFFELNKFDDEKNKGKLDQENKNIGDENKNISFSENLKKQTHFSIKKEVKTSNNYLNKINNSSNSTLTNINTSLFTTRNIKKSNENSSNIIETSKPFQTYNARLFVKNNQNANKHKSTQAKIFHIEKIFNKREYKDANEKESDEEDKNLKNRFKISLKKIKQTYTNSCLKIFSYINDKNIKFTENNLNNEEYISNIIQQVYEIIKNKKINSSKMNEILQVNDDDKYRKHYFMFTSEAKQFCLDLINLKKLSFDIVMKMCKVPRKSLRRWSHVGCNRKKGCGRKTRNPEMESKLVEWYKEVTAKNISVSAKMIRDKAVEISEDKDFLASKGWLEKFKKKFNIRIVTHKNKNFKKIISFKEKSNKINKEGKDSKGKEESEVGNETENENENNDKSEDEVNINDSKNKEIKKSNSITSLVKYSENKNKIIKENSYKKPIFLKTKVMDRGNSKKFNVFKYSDNNTI